MPFGVRHQSACATGQSAASCSAAVAGIRVSGYRAGHRRSRSGVAGRSIGGAEPVGRVFNPKNNDEVHRNLSPANSERFRCRFRCFEGNRTGFVTCGHRRSICPADSRPIRNWPTRSRDWDSTNIPRKRESRNVDGKERNQRIVFLDSCLRRKDESDVCLRRKDRANVSQTTQNRTPFPLGTRGLSGFASVRQHPTKR